MRSIRLVLLTWLLLQTASGACADALDRLDPEKLEALHRAVLALGEQQQPLKRPGDYKDYRALLHVHSAWSHDSRGTIEEIVAAARATNTRILLFSEHPADHYDFYKDGHRGIRDGVLLIPGAETKGFLVFPTQSLRGLDQGSPQEFTDLVRGRGGLVFLSHLEERMDWEIRGLTGVEIYNTHANFKDQKRLIGAMRNPAWVFKSSPLFKKYPQEAFSALLEYPADYLKRWDQLCAKTPHTGVAANDSHQNVGFLVRLLADNKLRLEDPLGKKLLEVKSDFLPMLEPLCKDKKVGEVVFELRLDPYENSFRHVGTHLLLSDFSEKGVWEALETGRAFVAFDWLADASGFDFAAQMGERRHEMGSRVDFADGLSLRGQAPLPVHWKLMRNGKLFAESTGRGMDLRVTEPGNYRAEAWLTVAGEEMIWVLSNPVYVRGGR